jgi:hypothetical protein
MESKPVVEMVKMMVVMKAKYLVVSMDFEMVVMKDSL